MTDKKGWLKQFLLDIDVMSEPFTLYWRNLQTFNSPTVLHTCIYWGFTIFHIHVIISFALSKHMNIYLFIWFQLPRLVPAVFLQGLSEIACRCLLPRTERESNSPRLTLCLRSRTQGHLISSTLTICPLLYHCSFCNFSFLFSMVKTFVFLLFILLLSNKIPCGLYLAWWYLNWINKYLNEGLHSKVKTKMSLINYNLVDYSLVSISDS